MRQELLLLLVGTALGCHHAGSRRPLPKLQSTSAPTPLETWHQTTLTPPPTPARPVKAGGLPLVYMLGAASAIRVIDETSGERLAEIDVPPNTIVSVDQVRGVCVGGAPVAPGPLSEDHRFAIYLQSDQPNIFRNGAVRPGVATPANHP